MTNTHGTRYGAVSRAVWRVMDRLQRHRLEQLEFEQERDELRRLLNDGDGSLVVARYHDLLGADPCEPVTCDVGRIWMPRKDSVILPTLKSRGTWEPEEVAFLRAHVGIDSRVVNAGANVGYTALHLSTIVGPSGQVVALEPDTLNFTLLCTNTRRARNVLPIHTAAGAETSSITLNRSATNAGDHRTAPHEDDIGGITVPMVRIDDLFEGSRIDAIVSDTQGFDHQVLAGATTTIERCRPLVTVEFWPFGIRNAGGDPVAVLESYRSLGYRSIMMVPTGEDVTRCSNDEIIAKSIADLDHTTLALVP